MVESQPRFEFRVWDQELHGPAGRLGELAEPVATGDSDEIYIVAEGCDDTNTKIRDDLLDVKILRNVVRRCEQWQPWIKAEFPITASLLTESLLPRLGAAELSLASDSYGLPELLEQLQDHPRIGVANLSKRRIKYEVSGCLAETAVVMINSSELHTVAIESADLDSLCELRDRLQLGSYENVSYPRAIKLTMYHTSGGSELRSGH
jgi:hypothetical protein